MVIPHIMPETLKENHKGQFDTPETGIEESYHSGGFSQVQFRLVLGIGRRWKELVGSDRVVQVQTILAVLPQYGIDQERNPSKKNQAVIY